MFSNDSLSGCFLRTRNNLFQTVNKQLSSELPELYSVTKTAGIRLKIFLSLLHYATYIHTMGNICNFTEYKGTYSWEISAFMLHWNWIDFPYLCPPYSAEARTLQWQHAGTMELVQCCLARRRPGCVFQNIMTRRLYCFYVSSCRLSVVPSLDPRYVLRVDVTLQPKDGTCWMPLQLWIRTYESGNAPWELRRFSSKDCSMQPEKSSDGILCYGNRFYYPWALYPTYWGWWYWDKC